MEEEGGEYHLHISLADDDLERIHLLVPHIFFAVNSRADFGREESADLRVFGIHI